MRKPIVGLLTGLIFVVGQGAAMAATDARCLTRDEREGQSAYTARVHNTCDARWRSFLPARAASGKAYNDYMRRCDKPCGAVATAGVSSAALVAGGVLVAGGAAAAAAGSKGGGSPASP